MSYPIYPLNPKHIANLMIGGLDVCATIRSDELRSTLADAGGRNVAGQQDDNR